MPTLALAIHGGCGVMAEHHLDAAEWAGARDAMAQALRAGWSVLTAGGRALDAVEAAVVVMEDAPHFNAGHGAALNAEGEHELDAAIMDGSNLAAGAIIAARRIRNPIRAARALLDGNAAVILTGPAADRYAAERGLAMVQPSYFTTTRRQQNLDVMKAHARAGRAASASEAEKHGTVGAVALDHAGHLAAATSTGGYTDKPPGRVGDSPIIGAGTYARDGICAVSGTGQGEFFIRHVLGHDVASRMAYRGDGLEQATAGVMADLAPYRIGAGLIAVDGAGRVAMPFNTPGMFRGAVTSDGQMVVATHGEVSSIGKADPA